MLGYVTEMHDCDYTRRYNTVGLYSNDDNDLYSLEREQYLCIPALTERREIASQPGCLSSDDASVCNTSSTHLQQGATVGKH